jgi:hypothetical protein
MAKKIQECEVLGLTPSFGFGDRLGIATPGHVEAMKRAGAGMAAIFPQQSIREMTRTNRTPEQVMADAMNGAKESGWKGPIGADADHLKTKKDVDITAAAGFTFFTIDPSDYVDQKANDYSLDEVDEKYAEIAGTISWFDDYVGTTVELPSGGNLELTELICKRTAIKYGRAIKEAIALGKYIAKVSKKLGRDHEIELSVDETEQATSFGEHYIIAHQCKKAKLNLVSLAPRFIGSYEKGIDFKGDREVLSLSLRHHAAIAELLGPYKLSLHSGSDKLSMYTMFAHATKGRFHVKTAGTSYLEALRVAAIHDEALFRRIVTFSRERYSTDRATYHVSATLKSAPDQKKATLETLVDQYLENWDDVPQGKGFTRPGRQILHCTFGSVLTHKELGGELREVLNKHQDTYTEVLADHFERHLQALSKGIPG